MLTDIHSHLLPEIDDGAKTFDDTIGLSTALQGFGEVQFITTPPIIQHAWENTHEQIRASKLETKQQLEESNITIPFTIATEYLINDQCVKLFQSRDPLTLKDNYVLVEMSYIKASIQLYSILFDLQVAGYIPVLAHLERYLFYRNNFNEYLKL